MIEQSRQYKICKHTTSQNVEVYDIWILKADDSQDDVYANGLSLIEALQKALLKLAEDTCTKN
jgi:hypothetical protein